MDITYDIIFAGGGTAACVAAGRLAATCPSLRILILEAGPGTRDKAILAQPARAAANVFNPNSETIRHHISRPSEALLGRSPVISTAQCLGGGSSINLMMYTRASASDYDDWEKVYQNPGWGSKDLIPLLQKAETYYGCTPHHGSSGPIKVSYRDCNINVADDFLDAAQRYDKKRLLTDDVNGFFSCNSYGRWPQYIDPASGRRSDVASNYVYNQLDSRQNLVVLCEKRVIRILFQGNKAVGVEYTGSPDDQIATVRASRLIVLSAGALGTPTILQRSGIGNVEFLTEHNVIPLVDLPGVGEHYMDHCNTAVPYVVSDDAQTLDVLSSSDEEGLLPFVQEWRDTGKGLLAHNGIDSGIKLRPHPEELYELGQEFEQIWPTYFAPAPDKPVVVLCPSARFPGITRDMQFKKFVSMVYYLCYSVSLGYVRITSGIDAYAPIDIHPGFLEAPADIGALRWAYKRGRELVRRMKMFRGEVSQAHPKFPYGSAAECKFAEGPVAADAPDIVYSEDDDEAIDEFHREKVATTWHSMGTCAMKPREDGGVVDSRLNVYGTQCLKVADCSIAPANVGANTCNTAIAIGEKAAILIGEDLGITGL